MTPHDSRPGATVEVYRLLLDSVPDALVLVNGAGVIELANAQAEGLFGYGPGELPGLPVDQLVAPRLRGGHADHRKTFFASPKLRAMSTRGQLRGLRRDGTEFAIEINLAPVRTDAGLLVSAAIRGVTEQRLPHGQLEFLGSMGHELRSPLNAIIGFSELLHGGKAGPLSPKQQEFIGDVLASARHLLRLINELLDRARVEAGKERA